MSMNIRGLQSLSGALSVLLPPPYQGKTSQLRQCWTKSCLLQDSYPSICRATDTGGQSRWVWLSEPKASEGRRVGADGRLGCRQVPCGCQVPGAIASVRHRSAQKQALGRLAEEE